MAQLQQSDQQQLWTEAQRRCRLSDEAVCMAKELGLNPRNLLKNTPSPKQQWTAPVEAWARQLYEKRHGATSRRRPVSPSTAPSETEREP